MTYQALYRKWRPTVFEDVVGQDHITTTLKNQIKSKNISHAYLFSGTRGTGKTSTAKIFARAINCIEPNGFDPCNHCEVCHGILSENIMDVIEIDAASNNGVDHIREIRENVKYPPSKGKYKVYIIDEVHMLSTGAFNALLKTLEEPPSHVVFILATTEPHKLPATILSRCQRFDFKPVKNKDIVERLARICNSMDIAFEEKALWTVARNGRGGLRDSLSILEQCISFSRGKLTYEEVVNTLGLTNEEVLMKLVDAIHRRNASDALKIVQSLIMEGKDVQLLIKDLINYIRQLLLLRMKVVEADRGEDSREIAELMEKQSQTFKEEDIIRYIYSLTEAEGKAKYASQPQIILEVTLVGLCNPQMDQSIDGLIQRIEDLEQMVKNANTRIVSAPQMVAENKQINNTTKAHSTTTRNQNQYKTSEVEKQEESVSINRGSAPIELKKIKAKWADILETIRQNKKAQIKAFLMEGEIIDLKGETLVIGFKDGFSFHRDALNKEKTKNFIIEVIHKVTGQQVQLSLIMESELHHQKSNQGSYDPIDQLKNILPEDMFEIVED
ncbi:DNA polymerase-3 subunit gamma/tau [Alkaliphilus hydrothermalis]|uniref:DNA-directed DNA polymerase n=2 Tax=Alkaliphilus hydrothermalis TaxID=1482730 RepID=A0ABS2NRL5_9FIRM|nr:DNA polymerase-3 subunit gamma/tau [Alkaliphilus hydrothermalis]